MDIFFLANYCEAGPITGVSGVELDVLWTLVLEESLKVTSAVAQWYSLADKMCHSRLVNSWFLFFCD